MAVDVDVVMAADAVTGGGGGGGGHVGMILSVATTEVKKDGTVVSAQDTE